MSIQNSVKLAVMSTPMKRCDMAKEIVIACRMPT